MTDPWTRPLEDLTEDDLVTMAARLRDEEAAARDHRVALYRAVREFNETRGIHGRVVGRLIGCTDTNVYAMVRKARMLDAAEQ